MKDNNTEKEYECIQCGDECDCYVTVEHGQQFLETEFCCVECNNNWHANNQPDSLI